MGKTLDYISAHVAAVKSLAGYGLTSESAEEIVSRMEDNHPEEWTRTLDRVANGEAKRVRLFVVWNDIRDFSTFLYSGDQDSTVAHLFRSLASVSSGAFVDTDPAAGAGPAETEGYNEVACFDIGRELGAAGLSSRSAAELVGCCGDTARYYRRAMEHAGLVEPVKLRRTSAGLVQDTSNMGAYALGLCGVQPSNGEAVNADCARLPPYWRL